MAKTHICVGGPKAGQRVVLKDGSHYFRVALPPTTPVGHFSPTKFPHPAEVRYVEYREQTLFAYGDHIGHSFWAPSDQTPKQSMELLLETYEQHQTRRVP